MTRPTGIWRWASGLHICSACGRKGTTIELATRDAAGRDTVRPPECVACGRLQPAAERDDGSHWHYLREACQSPVGGHCRARWAPPGLPPTAAAVGNSLDAHAHRIGRVVAVLAIVAVVVGIVRGVALDDRAHLDRLARQDRDAAVWAADGDTPSPAQTVHSAGGSIETIALKAGRYRVTSSIENDDGWGGARTFVVLRDDRGHRIPIAARRGAITVGGITGLQPGTILVEVAAAGPYGAYPHYDAGSWTVHVAPIE